MGQIICNKLITVLRLRGTSWVDTFCFVRVFFGSPSVFTGLKGAFSEQDTKETRTKFYYKTLDGKVFIVLGVKDHSVLMNH